jgi:hypothetical protein
MDLAGVECEVRRRSGADMRCDDGCGDGVGGGTELGVMGVCVTVRR